jgi:thymidylate synthase (FAD)
MDSHAQLEVRKYAICIGEEIVKKWCPITWEAFLDYVYHGTSLTKLDLEIIKLINSGDTDGAIKRAIEFGLLNEDQTIPKKSREREELEEKLNEMSISIPW